MSLPRTNSGYALGPDDGEAIWFNGALGLLLVFGPAGVEDFFRGAATPARSFNLPPAGEPVPDRESLIEIMRQHGQDVVGPPLPAKG